MSRAVSAVYDPSVKTSSSSVLPLHSSITSVTWCLEAGGSRAQALNRAGGGNRRANDCGEGGCAALTQQRGWE